MLEDVQRQWFGHGVLMMLAIVVMAIIGWRGITGGTARAH